MLIHLHTVYFNAGIETISDIWLNPINIMRVMRCTTEHSSTNSYVSMKDEYNWRMIEVTETPEEIEELINKEVAKWGRESKSI